MPTDAAARARLLVQGIIHPDEMDRFATLCQPTAPGELAGLRLRTQAHLAWARQLAARSSAVDLDAAERVAGTLLRLLDEPDEYDDEQRALLRGATEYFLDVGDADNDQTDALGFDDDVRVLNAVLDSLGRRDLLITL